jgi:hypothetical protein
MTVDLNVLDHLGINLYSNIAAVLTEAVANAWDADAGNVIISIDKKKDIITIEDDGCGMSIEDVNNKYLHIGYRRRLDESDKTSKGRPVMGRKGLGKLSLFSIADIIEVQSYKNKKAHGLRMNVADIRAALKANKVSYSPSVLPKKDIKIKKGTSITLREITRPKLFESMTALRTQLARRFSVIGDAFNFTVKVNGKNITIADREELTKAQFIWRIGDVSLTLPKGCDIKEDRFIDSPEGKGLVKIRGWIATSNVPKDLSTPAGNLNCIVVMARGRLIQENILDKLNLGQMYTKYLTGQIEADVLDDTEGKDIATSDRQRLQEDDPRYVALLKTLRTVLSKVESEWSELRKKYEVAKVKVEIPAVAEWLDALPMGFRKNAEKVVAQISALPVERPEERKTLLRHGILAFERIKLTGTVDDFVQGLSNVDQLLKILADRDSLESSLYRDIIKSRLEAINGFCGLVDADKKEAVLQKYLFDHLWLLDPMWERATDSERIEQTLKKEYEEFAADLSDEESKGRLDIRYKTNAGAHIIVELKKVRRKMSLPELQEQGQKYRSALTKCLKNVGIDNPDIQIVFVLGQTVRESDNIALGGDAYVRKTLAPLGARVVYYEQMIENATKAYSEYLSQSKKMDKLDAILDQIK